jgi:NO-binding membrane sensor protein with MHYT domain
MQGTVDGFNYGLLTPVGAYLMACLGSALGLRCVARTLVQREGSRVGWLALGAACLGVGIWTMHFIAMIGFQVEETSISYDAPLTVASLVVAIGVVSVGVAIVGRYGAAPVPLATAGVLTGLGVATMHYMGMAAMRMDGELRYDTTLVVLSVVIAVVAATAALWAAVSIRGFLPSLGASLVMGLAISGMHYTGMAALSVELDADHLHSMGQSNSSFLLPMIAGPLIFLVLAAVVVMLDPSLILGEEDRYAERRYADSRYPEGRYAEPRTGHHGSSRTHRRADRPRVRV